MTNPETVARETLKELERQSVRLWGDIERYREDVERIAQTGIPLTPEDILLVQKVFCLVTGDLCVRKGRSKYPE